MLFSRLQGNKIKLEINGRPIRIHTLSQSYSGGLRVHLGMYFIGPAVREFNRHGRRIDVYAYFRHHDPMPSLYQSLVNCTSSDQLARSNHNHRSNKWKGKFDPPLCQLWRAFTYSCVYLFAPRLRPINITRPSKDADRVIYGLIIFV